MSEEKSKTSLSKGNKFYIMGGFNDEMIEDIIIPLDEKIQELKKQKKATIEIHISSHGGYSSILLKLIALVEEAKKAGITVKTIVTYAAYSCGSRLAVTGTKGERYIDATAEHLVHYGHIGEWDTCTPLQNDRQYDRKKRWFEKIVNHYEKYCNIPKLREVLKDDAFFIDSKKCIKWGLADKLL